MSKKQNNMLSKDEVLEIFKSLIESDKHWYEDIQTNWEKAMVFYGYMIEWEEFCVKAITGFKEYYFPVKIIIEYKKEEIGCVQGNEAEKLFDELDKRNDGKFFSLRYPEKADGKEREMHAINRINEHKVNVINARNKLVINGLVR